MKKILFLFCLLWTTYSFGKPAEVMSEETVLLSEGRYSFSAGNMAKGIEAEVEFLSNVKMIGFQREVFPFTGHHQFTLTFSATVNSDSGQKNEIFVCKSVDFIILGSLPPHDSIEGAFNEGCFGNTSTFGPEYFYVFGSANDGKQYLNENI